MKLKDIEGLLPEKRPQKEKWEDFDWQTEGWNHSIDACGEKELEIDVDELEKFILNTMSEFHATHAGEKMNYRRYIAQAIASKFPVRVKK